MGGTRLKHKARTAFFIGFIKKKPCNLPEKYVKIKPLKDNSKILPMYTKLP